MNHDYLSSDALVGARGEEEPNHLLVVLLGRHVQRREPILRLHVDGCSILDEELHHLELTAFTDDKRRFNKSTSAIIPHRRLRFGSKSYH